MLNALVTNSDEVGLRTFEIGAGAGAYLSPKFIQQAFKNYFSSIDSLKEEPLQQAFETYLSVITIHPFENGNGRTARLAADFYLFKNNILPVSFKSPVLSHVALVKNNVKRSKDESYLKFLKAVENSYNLVFSA